MIGKALVLAGGLLAVPGLTAPAPAAPAASAVVRIAPAVTVRDDSVLLGDIATIEGDAGLASRLRGQRIAAAPALGATSSIDGETVRRRIRLTAADAPRVTLVVPDRVVLTRAAQTVSAAAIVEAARHAALARLERAEAAREASPATGGAREPIALVVLGGAQDVRVPAGDVALSVRIDEGPAGSTFVSGAVTVSVLGRDWHTSAVSFRVTRFRRVVVAAAAIQPRATLGPRDVRVESRPATDVPQDALTDLADTGELEATQSLRPGDVVTTRAVRPRLLVRRGELVTLVLEGASFRITSQGLAGEDARRGDTVRVVNTTSKREVIGRVEGAGIVHVPFRSARSQP